MPIPSPRRPPSRARLTLRLLVSSLLILATATTLIACSEPERPTLRLAINPWVGYGFFGLAEERGFLASPSAPRLEIIETTSLSDSVRAFERGQVDMIGGTLAELVDINAHGNRAARAILVLDRSVGGDMIVARAGIEDVAQLEGRRVAFEPGSVNALVLHAAATQVGLDLSRIELIAMPQSEMPAALADGQIDAAVTYPPVAQALLVQPGAHRLFDTRSAPDAVIDVLIVAADRLEASPSALEALVDAHDRAVAWGRQHPDEARTLLAAQTGETPAEIDSALAVIEMLRVDEQTAMWRPDGPLQRGLEGAGQVMTLLHDHGPSERHSPAEMLDDRFVNRNGPP